MRSALKAFLALFVLLFVFSPRVRADTGDAIAGWSESLRQIVFRVDSAGNVYAIGTINNTLTGDVAAAFTGVPVNTATKSFVRIGNAISGGDTTSNGGTWFSINSPGSGAGSAADYIHIQSNGSTRFKVASTGQVTATGDLITSAADVMVTGVGHGLKIKEGSNAKMGVATLNGSGWVTVATTAVSATSRVLVTGQTSTGACYVKSRVNGTSFSIYSTDSSDSGTAAWMIVDPAP